MLSERERRTLDRIEQELRASDPDLAQMFRQPMRPPWHPTLPQVLLVLGLGLVVLGTATVSVPVAALGMVVSVAGLGVALRRTMLNGGLSPA